MLETDAQHTLLSQASALAVRCVALVALWLGAAVVAPATSETSEANETTEVDAQIRIRVIDAPLPLVLETLANNAGLEVRIDSRAASNTTTITDTLNGSSEGELRRIAGSHGLALFIDGNVAWIDDVNKRHSATIVSSRDVAAKVYDLLVEQPVVDEGLVRQNRGTLELTGTRAFVQLTARRASSIIDTIMTEAAAEEPQNKTPRTDQPDTKSRAAAGDLAGEKALSEPVTASSLQPVVLDKAPVSKPAVGRRVIRSITDVPGFDTDYTE